MRIADYLPTPQQVTREVLAVLIATVAAAYIISKWPEAQRLVRAHSIPSPLDQA